MAKTIVKPRIFLDAEAKRNAGGNGIQPTAPVPIKILKPTRYYSMLGFVRSAEKRGERFSLVNQPEQISRDLPQMRSDRTESGRAFRERSELERVKHLQSLRPRPKLKNDRLAVRSG